MVFFVKMCNNFVFVFWKYFGFYIGDVQFFCYCLSCEFIVISYYDYVDVVFLEGFQCCWCSGLYGIGYVDGVDGLVVDGD